MQGGFKELVTQCHSAPARRSRCLSAW